MNDKEIESKIKEVSKTIFSYCMARTAGREEAEDLSQDILIELLKSYKCIRDDKAFYGFMWGIAGNVYKQWLRRKSKNVFCELPEDAAAYDTDEDDSGEEEILLLRRELTLLSEKYRKATILYYIDGKSCSEIASLLTISESMVKYLLFKSRNILKEGMKMERKLGELSYNPKKLFPMYSGQGPNQFWQFMQSKIKQNIVLACYNDSLTVQQISIETGIPLPYLDEEIRELESKNIIVKEGTHYKTNIIVISSECVDEIMRSAAKYHEIIAEKVKEFIENNLGKYKELGFAGCDFSDNTLRWQLATVMFRMIGGIDCKLFRNEKENKEAPQTGWGEQAFIWCVEKFFDEKHLFNYSGVGGKKGDIIYFFDYLKGGKGDHHDFFGKERIINIFCDICRNDTHSFGEYDLESVANMIEKGYVIKDGETIRAATPIYTREQYQTVQNMVKDFLTSELSEIINEMDIAAAEVLSAHTPKHLQDQVNDIAGLDIFTNVVCIPADILIEEGFLSTSWHALEMPTTFVVLNS